MAEEHIKVLYSMKEIELVGIYSRNVLTSDNLARKYKIPYIACSVSDLYKKSKPDAVIVAVPELALKNILKESTKYPWVHLIEKPAGYNFKDAIKIVNLKNISNSTIFVGLNRRHYDSTNTVIRELQNCNSKRIVSVTDQQDPSRALSSGQPKLVVSNWMFANSIHLIDYFTILCRGEVLKVSTKKIMINRNQSIIKAEIGFTSGDLGFYTAFWNMPGPWSVSCASGNSYWELKPLEQVAYRSLSEPISNLQKIHKADVKYKPGLLKQARELVKFLESGVSSLPSLDESLKSMSLVRDIYEERKR